MPIMSASRLLRPLPRRRLLASLFAAPAVAALPAAEPVVKPRALVLSTMIGSRIVECGPEGIGYEMAWGKCAPNGDYEIRNGHLIKLK